MAGAGLLTIAVLLVIGVIQLALLPFALILRVRARTRAMPLVQRNHVRAGIGGALVALAGGLAFVQLPPILDYFIDPIRVWLIAGLAGIGLLYFGGGVAGSQAAQFDYFSAGWWAVLVAACAALLIFGIPV